MEGHILVTLDSAETMRDVLDEVNSPAIRCDLDPVNWLTLHTVFRSGPAIDRMVDVLGSRIFNAHAKDVVVEKRLSLHINEVPAGQGILDWERFMRGSRPSVQSASSSSSTPRSRSCRGSASFSARRRQSWGFRWSDRDGVESRIQNPESRMGTGTEEGYWDRGFGGACWFGRKAFC